MSSTRWPNPPRAPLSHGEIAQLLSDFGIKCGLEVVESTGSTNTDLLGRRLTSPLLLVAEEQSAGRGRLDRSWIAAKGSGLTFSLFIPDGHLAMPLTLMPLRMGVAVVRAMHELTTIPAKLKWPNDVMVDDRKLGGILSVKHPDGVVIGCGLNVTLLEDELPDARATSIWLERESAPDRQMLLVRIVQEMFTMAIEGFLLIYGWHSCTLGERVEVQLPNGEVVHGLAREITPDGSLLLQTVQGDLVVTAGDVVHVRH